MDQKTRRELVLLVLVSLLFLFSLPLQNHPLNDDYPYYKTVGNILDGKLILHQPIHMAFLAQGIYGAFVSSILGYSHASLIIGTRLLGILGVVASYLLFRRFVNSRLAFLGALTVLVNPFYVDLSNTFMTDVPRFAFSMVAVYLLFRGIETKNFVYLASGSVASLAAFWVRQPGLMAIAGVILYYFLTDRKKLLERRNALFFFVLPAASLVLWFYWYFFVHGPSDCIAGFFTVGLNVPRTIGRGALLLGYMLLPVAILCLMNAKSVWKNFMSLGAVRKTFVALLIVSMLGWLLYLNLAQSETIFYNYSLISHRGFGPTYNIISGDKTNLLFPEWLWTLITPLSIITTVSLTVYALRDVKDKKNLLLLSFVAAEILGFLFVRHFFDRYMLVLLPMLTVFLLRSLREHKHGQNFLLASIVLFGLFSWYGVHEYAAWNEARWEGIEYLLASGVPEESIDGGFEYNARFFEGCVTNRAVRWHGWGYSLSDAYVVSYSPLSGYEILKTFPYSGPFGEKLGEIFVLKKT